MTDLVKFEEKIFAPIETKMAESSINEEAARKVRSTVMIAVSENKRIMECTPESIQKEILKCTADGLVPDNKEAALIPYKNKDSGKLELQYTPMVLGIQKRLRELGNVHGIICNVVHANDEYKDNAAVLEPPRHIKPKFKDRGVSIGYYCIFYDKDQNVMAKDDIAKTEVTKIRNQSKAPNSPAWKNFFDEMGRKVILRRLAKYITLSDARLTELMNRMDDMFDFSEPQTTQKRDPFSGRTVDGEATEVEETTSIEDNSEDPEPSQEETKEEPKDKGLSVDDRDTLQGLHDHLFASLRTPEDIQADFETYKADNKLDVEGHLKQKINGLLDLHKRHADGKIQDKFLEDACKQEGMEFNKPADLRLP